MHAELAQHRAGRAEPRRRVVVAGDRDDVHRRPPSPRRREQLEPHSFRARRRGRAVEHVSRDHQHVRCLALAGLEQPRQEGGVLVLARHLLERVPEVPVGCVEQPHPERARSHGGLIGSAACIDSRASRVVLAACSSGKGTGEAALMGPTIATRSPSPRPRSTAPTAPARWCAAGRLDFFEAGPGADCTDGSLRSRRRSGSSPRWRATRAWSRPLPAPGEIPIVTDVAADRAGSGRREHGRRGRRRDRRQPQPSTTFHLNAQSKPDELDGSISRRPAPTAPAAPSSITGTFKAPRVSS